MSLHEYLKQFEVPQDLAGANTDLLRRQSEEYVFIFCFFVFTSHFHKSQMLRAMI